MGFKDLVNQVVYAFSSEDRYAEYSSYNPQNHHQHHSENSNNVHTSHPRQEIELNESNTFEDSELSNAGVSETLLAWRHIETWTTENHGDLNASLADPVTRMDILKAEEDLGVALPVAVRASFRIHDGQEGLESLTGSGGLFFGLRLMDLNDVVATTKHWRLVAHRVELDSKVRENKMAREALISPTGSSLSLDKQNKSTLSLNETTKGYGKLTTDENSIDPDLERKISTSHKPLPAHPQQQQGPHIPRQKSIPPGAVKPLYANNNWIPLITDDSGNHIGVDLDPDHEGVLGQVIIFGRDFDTKFVLAPNWGDFLLSFVKELENGNYNIESDVDDVFAGEGELVFFDKQIHRQVPYLSYLTHKVLAYWRAHNPTVPTKTSESKTGSSGTQQQQKNDNKTPAVNVKKDERIISHDITATKEEDLKQDTEILKIDTEEEKEETSKGEEHKKPVETDAKATDKDKEENDEVNKSQDIADVSLVNDFKDVQI